MLELAFWICYYKYHNMKRWAMITGESAFNYAAPKD